MCSLGLWSRWPICLQTDNTGRRDWLLVYTVVAGWQERELTDASKEIRYQSKGAGSFAMSMEDGRAIEPTSQHHDISSVGQVCPQFKFRTVPYAPCSALLSVLIVSEVDHRLPEERCVAGRH